MAKGSQDALQSQLEQSEKAWLLLSKTDLLHLEFKRAWGRAKYKKLSKWCKPNYFLFFHCILTFPKKLPEEKCRSWSHCSSHHPHTPTSPHPSPIFVLKSKNVLSYQDLKTPREPNPPGEESGATNSHNFQSE